MPAVRGVDLRRELERAAPTGWSPARARLRARALDLIRAEELAEGRYSYAILAVEEIGGDAVRAGGAHFRASRLLPQTGTLTALGCGVCSLGPRLEARVAALFQERRAALAVMVDEIGNELLFALGRRVQDRMLSECVRRRLSMGVELHSGDPGLAIDTQDALLRLAGADRIGVAMHGSQLMTPLKSGSVVYAIGRDLPEAHWSRCDSCPSAGRCNFGRVATEVRRPAAPRQRALA